MLLIKRITYPLLLLCFCLNSYCQTITGLVINKTNKQPINNALVTLGTAKTYTNTLGMFEIPANNITDSLRITHFVYKPVVVSAKTTAVLRIEMEPATISLDAVTIHGTRDFKQDSLDNRLAYARQFNYRAPQLKDAFSADANKQPGELLSINLLTVVDVLTKKSTPEYKFNKILLNDEHAAIVDHKFNRGNVGRITGLKDDTLSTFLVNYRPNYEFARKATDYDMEVYIRKCFKEFKQDGMNAANPFHDAANKDTARVRLN